MNAMKLYYKSRWCYLHHLRPLAIMYKALIYIFCNCYIPYTADIGKNCSIAYRGMSVVIHARAKIGDNCVIGTCVTIGGQKKQYGVPVIGNNCYLATGCKIFGPITIGDGCFIGANTVVTRDVPSKSLVSGIPAKIIKTDIDVGDYC